MSSIIDETYDYIEKGRQGRNVGLPFQPKPLSDYLGNLQRSTYYLFGGNTGTGKTALIDTILLTAYEQALSNQLEIPLDGKKLKGIYFSLEIPAFIKIGKWICMWIYRKYNVEVGLKQVFSIGDNRLDDDTYHKVKEAKEYFKVLLQDVIIIDHIRNPTGMYKFCKEFMQRNGTRVQIGEEGGFKKYKFTTESPDCVYFVVCDHVGKMTLEQKFKRKENIDKWSEYCVELRNDWYMSPINVSQFNREIANVERLKINDMRPKLEDFKETGSTQEDADIVGALFNPHRYGITNYFDYNITDHPMYRAVFILKNRIDYDMTMTNCNLVGGPGFFEEIHLVKTRSKYARRE